MNPKEILEQLVDDLFNEDELGSVIRAHIRIESLLLNIIDLTAPNPHHVSKLKLDFDKTVTLSLILGLNEEYAMPLRALGKLRNDFAHKPKMQLSKNSVNNIYSTLNSEAKNFVQESFIDMKKESVFLKPFDKFKDIPPVDQLRFIVVSIWAQIQSTLVILNAE